MNERLTKEEKKILKRFKRLLAFVNEMGLGFEAFDNRKKIRSLVYLAQTFGIDLGYPFVWYLYSVGSPELTQDLVLIGECL